MNSIDISGLSSTYTDYLATQTENLQAEKLQNSVSGDYANATDEELMDACKQFEAYFLEQMFKEMEKTVMKSDSSQDSSTSNLVDYFKDTAVQELAANSTESNSLGLAQTLFEQMKRNYNI